MEKILVVDDDPVVRGFNVRALQQKGYQVIGAGSAREALGIIGAGENFDLILSDVQMPGMNGLEFLRVLRHQGIETPVIATTGLDQKDPLLNKVRGEFNGVLFKPFPLGVLYTTVQAALIFARATSQTSPSPAPANR